MVATQSLGPLGSVETRPAVVPWKWYYYAAGAPLWLLVATILVLFKENRRWQAWMIFLPLGVVAIAWRMLARLFAASDGTSEMVAVVVMSCAMGWAIVWLMGHHLGKWCQPARFFAALALLAAVGGFACVSYLGKFDSDYLPTLATFVGVISAVLLLAMTLSGRACRRGRFMRLLFAWIALTAMATLTLCGASALLLTGGDVAMLPGEILYCAVMSLLASCAVYLFNLPFMLLAFNNPFYRARFHAIFCPEKGVTVGIAEAGLPNSPVAVTGSPEPCNAAPDSQEGCCQAAKPSASKAT